MIEEQALERAREADAALAKGENWGVFHGVPITIKDAFQLEGVVTRSIRMHRKTKEILPCML